ncbi:DUF892 family protein [Granulicella sp. dw_53]|uniref:DUF892 family protein n=1 Tax=Granulicella sp. dw_53 TaxID=2719792 RepID=UPI002102ECC8|nr:DUF892 family protein [Granulicella sp. dw_53]
MERGKDALEKKEEGASFDAGLIGAALRTEHYEIADYEDCISIATALGMSKVIKLLHSNLKEELATAKKFTVAGTPTMKQSAEADRPEKRNTWLKSKGMRR